MKRFKCLSQSHWLLLVAASLVVACAAVPSPNNTTTWKDPNFKGPPFRKVFVVGLSAQSLRDQHGFEDLMVSTLQRSGVTAVPGWRFIPTNRTPDPSTIRAAVAQSGADSVLLVRISPVTTQGALNYGMVGGVAQEGPDMTVGWYEPGLVSTTWQAATIYTTLFDVKTARQVWTFNSPTYSPATIEQDAPRFASDMTGLLLSNGLVGGGY